MHILNPIPHNTLGVETVILHCLSPSVTQIFHLGKREKGTRRNGSNRVYRPTRAECGEFLPFSFGGTDGVDVFIALVQRVGKKERASADRDLLQRLFLRGYIALHGVFVQHGAACGGHPIVSNGVLHLGEHI